MTSSSCRFYSLACVTRLAHNCVIARQCAAHGADDEDRRCQANRLFDAADQPVVSARALPLLQPGISSSSPTAPIRKRSRPWCPSRSKSTEPIVKYEFIRMPDSTGFGDYTETGQVIPVRFNGAGGRPIPTAMYLDDDAPIAGGRELWGFPKKRAIPKIAVESDVAGGHRCITARCSAPPAPWATSIGRSIMTPC